jgi:hypothetical protein
MSRENLSGENIRLLRTGSPKADESLMGYVVRLTEQNGYETPLWILKMAGLVSNKALGCSFIFKSSECLYRLTQITGASMTKLESLIYPPAETTPDTHCLFFRLPIPRYLVRPARPKVCPICLSESNYCRRVWELSIVTVCLKHKCLLIDECPSCKRNIRWIRNRISVYSCEFDWREATVIPVEESEVTLTRHVHCLCGLSLNQIHEQDSTNPNPLLDLELQDLLSVLFFIAGHHQGLSVTTSKHLLSLKRNEDFHAVFTKAFSVFENWPNAYYQLLDWVRKREKGYPPIRQRQKSVLYRAFGKFYASLFKILSGSQFEFIKKAFIEYLIRRWDGGHALSSNLLQSATPCHNSKYISKSDVVRLIDISNRKVDQLIEIGNLKAIVLSKGKKRLFFIDLMEITKLRV